MLPFFFKEGISKNGAITDIVIATVKIPIRYIPE